MAHRRIAAPRTEELGAAAHPRLACWSEVDKGGHFAAFEQPELFTHDVRAAFRAIRHVAGNG